MTLKNNEQSVAPGDGATTSPAIGLMHEALASLHQASRGHAADVAGATFTQNEVMTLSIAANLPASAIVLNHGFVETDPDTVVKAADIYRNAGVARFFLSSMQQISKDVLDAADLAQARSWRLFSRDLTVPTPPVPNSVPVTKVDFDPSATFPAIIANAFDTGEASCPMLAMLPKAKGWHVFQAEIDGAPAGTGSLFTSGGFAWTDFGATAPAYRGRGAQTSLLAHRIDVARSLGCHTILTCTGEEVPGDPQVSYRNILSMSFQEAELLFNYAPR